MKINPELIPSDAYEWFFAIVAILIIFPLIGAVGMLLFLDAEHGSPFITYPLATLFASFIMMNMADKGASAKEVFWGWIAITFGFAAASGIGIIMIYTFTHAKTLIN